ncbi:MAG: hypothetical protein AUJ49_11440 [Desulfovibrionaceae bacterium CG1_02_65_16]|nr:MAG: hypothetical protein AUJ49_11440 [Desulfovibrionaceae bacterium CG1_02_65_16]
MKKMNKLALAAVLVLGLASAAQAADIKASGKWQIDASWSNDMDMNEATKENNFRIEQRVRTAFQFIANENLKGVLDTQIGTNAWGNGEYQIGAGRTASTTAGGANTMGNGSIMLRKAYLDYKWPGTKVNILAGFQTVSLPAAFGGGSAIFDDQVGALVVSAPIIDNVKVLAGYARPFDSNTSGSQTVGTTGSTASNVYFAAVPIDLAGSTNITPFGAFADAGAQSILKNDGTYSAPSGDTGFNSPRGGTKQGVKGYWGGVAFTTKLLDPFKIMADFNYGSVDYSEDNGGRSGWLADFAVDYTGLSMMTPEAFFVYSSGDDDSGNKRGGRMPTLGNPQSWSAGGMFFGDGDLISKGATKADTGGYGYSTRNVMGFWTVGVSLKDIKLIDKLTHRVNLLYVQGTNDKDAMSGLSTTSGYGNNQYGRYLTTRDSLWEIDLNNKYQLYDELALQLNLGYINADLHSYNGATTPAPKLDDSMYRVTMSMVYSF